MLLLTCNFFLQYLYITQQMGYENTQICLVVVILILHQILFTDVQGNV